MAEDEPILTDPRSHDVAIHVRDYARFTKMLKWSAVVSLLIGFIVLLILK